MTFSKLLLSSKSTVLLSVAHVRGKQFMIGLHHCYESVMQQNIMIAGDPGKLKWLTLWNPESKGRTTGHRTNRKSDTVV